MKGISDSESSCKKRKKTCNSPDWAELPGDTLSVIANKLMSHDIEDFVRMRAVCTSWRMVFLQHKKPQVCSSCSPFLLIAPPVPPEEEQLGNDYRQQRSVYSPGKNKVYALRLHVPHSWTSCGSSFGWLVNLEQKDQDRGLTGLTGFDVYLQNPFLNKIMHLPPIFCEPNTRDADIEGLIISFSLGAVHQMPNRKHVIHKAALSSDPLSSSGEFIVIAIMSTAKDLAFFKPGTKTWTPIAHNWKTPEPSIFNMFTDVIFYHKTNQFYVSCPRGEVFAVNLAGEDGLPKLTQASDALPGLPFSHTHLVEDLSSGDLYQFYIKSSCFPHPVPFRFDIYKLDATERKWIRVHDLGDNIIFFGSNGSFLRAVANCPGCRPNCIYFFTNIFEKQCYQLPYEEIYNLKDGSIQPLYTTSVRSPYTLPTTVWLEPTLL